MSFAYQEWLMSPFILMFVVLVTGILFGRIKFGKFDFGISGALFTGLVIGWGIMEYAKTFTEDSKYYKTAQSVISAGVIDKGFFDLFLIFFVAAVGLLAAKDIGAVLKKYGLKFVILGFLITAIGAGTTYVMTIYGPSINPYEVSGVYTGALTSSPGLAAALESGRGHAKVVASEYDTMSSERKTKFLQILDKSGALTPENTPTLTEAQTAQFLKSAEAGIGVGHAIGYPFGVLIVIFAMNFFPRIFRINVAREKEIFHEEMTAARKGVGGKEIPDGNFDLFAFIFACIVGYTIGSIVLDLSFIGLGNFSLGSTGGVLIGALILGHFGKIGFMNFRMDAKVLGAIRNLALGFFLAIVGLKYGFKVFDALMGSGVYLAVVATVVGIVALMAGFLIGRYVFKINWIMLSGALCGGMTSTPGLGAAVSAIGSDDPAAGYGATYPFAILGMVVFTIVLHNLPM